MIALQAVDQAFFQNYPAFSSLICHGSAAIAVPLLKRMNRQKAQLLQANSAAFVIRGHFRVCEAMRFRGFEAVRRTQAQNV